MKSEIVVRVHSVGVMKCCGSIQAICSALSDIPELQFWLGPLLILNGWKATSVSPFETALYDYLLNTVEDPNLIPQSVETVLFGNEEELDEVSETPAFVRAAMAQAVFLMIEQKAEGLLEVPEDLLLSLEVGDPELIASIITRAAIYEVDCRAQNEQARANEHLN